MLIYHQYQIYSKNVKPIRSLHFNQHNTTNKFTYVDCVYHMLFTTEIFQPLSRSSTRLQGVTYTPIQCINEPFTVKSVSQTSYTVTECQHIS
jgi:hypothetical protein